MPLTTDTAPRAVIAAAHRAIREARRARQGRGMRLPLAVSPGIQVFTVPADAVPSYVLQAAQPRGWIFLVIDADRRPSTFNISMTAGTPLATHRSFGAAPAALAAALHTIEQRSRAITIVRLLRIPDINFAALWLRTTRNRLQILHPRRLARARRTLTSTGKAITNLARRHGIPASNTQSPRQPKQRGRKSRQQKSRQAAKQL